MTRPLKLILVAGARPNFMKIAPLLHEIDARNRGTDDGPPIERLLVHTGQHYDDVMSELFFRELRIPRPDINLEIGSASHAVQTANVMIKFEPVCENYEPDWVIVVGDVNSTMACTLVASKLGVRVAHVEAGLRSCDRTMPEEINRVVTDALADLLLTPSADANENLAREGVPENRIELVGNIMIDALVANLDRLEEKDVGGELGLEGEAFIYVTLHRPGNVDCAETLAGIMDGLKTLSADMPIVFPLHPRTRKMLNTFGIPFASGPSFRVLEPIGYHESIWLAQNARAVVTDSGGLQEETTFFRTPCLTLRPNTERPVTTTLGSNKLTTSDCLIEDVRDALRAGKRSGKVPPLWDGKTASRIMDVVTRGSVAAGDAA